MVAIPWKFGKKGADTFSVRDGYFHVFIAGNFGFKYHETIIRPNLFYCQSLKWQKLKITYHSMLVSILDKTLTV